MVEVFYHLQSAKVVLFTISSSAVTLAALGSLPLQYNLLACGLCKVVPCGLGAGNSTRREWGKAAAGLQQHSVL